MSALEACWEQGIGVNVANDLLDGEHDPKARPVH